MKESEYVNAQNIQSVINAIAIMGGCTFCEEPNKSRGDLIVSNLRLIRTDLWAMLAELEQDEE